MFVISFLFLFIYVYLLYKTRNPLLFLPVFYSITVVYSYIGIKLLDFGINVPFDLYSSFPESQWDISLSAYFLSSLFFTFGLLCSGIKFKEYASKNNTHNALLTLVENKSDGLKSLLVILTILFLVLGYGLENILSRDGYVPSEGRVKPLLILYTIFLPISSFALAFINRKTLRLVLYIALFLLIFGTTARMLLLLPSLYYLGSCIKCGKLKIRFGVFTFILIVFIITYTLEYRNLPIQGVVPNIKHMIENGLDLKYISLGLNYIFSYSFASNSYSIHTFDFDLDAFFIAINPMPSRFLDIEYMLEKMSLNRNSPIPTVGYLFLSDFNVGILYYFLIGYMFNVIISYAKRHSGILFLCFLAVFCLFVFLSCQYNLRGTTRIFYYCVSTFIVYRLFRVFKYNININS